jgi:hypothetical protein
MKGVFVNNCLLSGSISPFASSSSSYDDTKRNKKRWMNKTQLNKTRRKKRVTEHQKNKQK